MKVGSIVLNGRCYLNASDLSAVLDEVATDPGIGVLSKGIVGSLANKINRIALSHIAAADGEDVVFSNKGSQKLREDTANAR